MTLQVWTFNREAMTQGEIYLTVEDLMRLIGSYSVDYTRRRYRQLHKETKKTSKSLTIGDYCRITGDDYLEVYCFLRGSLPAYVPESEPSAASDQTAKGEPGKATG